MTAVETILESARSRGLTIAIGSDGKLVFRGKKSSMALRSDALTEAIIAYGMEIIETLKLSLPRGLEILSCDGKVAPAPQDWKPDSGNLPNPTAMYWRSVGEMGWSVIVLKRKSP